MGGIGKVTNLQGGAARLRVAGDEYATSRRPRICKSGGKENIVEQRVAGVGIKWLSEYQNLHSSGARKRRWRIHGAYGRERENRATGKRICQAQGQWRLVLVGTTPITDAIPSVSIVFKTSASAALSVWKDSSQTVEFPNSSTTSSNHPPCPLS
jgi:hypothetical protein